MFYEVLAEYYDLIFPLEEAKVLFLDRAFRPTGAKKILDLACGTGAYTVALSKIGYVAWGSDLEPGMVALAREKALAAGARANFVVGDMREPEALGITFDGLFCIGNSLAHLTEEGDLARALRAMRGVLRKGGAAVFQIVNFDRILERGDTDLPLIERDTVRLIRKYCPRGEEKLVFDSRLEIRDDSGVTHRYENGIVLCPIRKAKLERLLARAGFTGINVYGDFKYGPWSGESQALVAVASA